MGNARSVSREVLARVLVGNLKALNHEHAGFVEMAGDLEMGTHLSRQSPYLKVLRGKPLTRDGEGTLEALNFALVVRIQWAMLSPKRFSHKAQRPDEMNIVFSPSFIRIVHNV